MEQDRSAGPMVWPRVWTAYLARMRRLLPIALVISALLIVGGFYAMSEGAYALGWAALVFSPFLVLGVTVGYLVRTAAARRGSWMVDAWKTGPAGEERQVTVLPMSRALQRVYRAFLIAATVVCVGAPFLAGALPTTPNLYSIRFHSWAPFLPLVAVYPLAVLLSRFIRGRREMGLGLAPEGVYSWTWFGCCFFNWDWVERIQIGVERELVVRLVVAEPLSRPSNPEENWVGQIEFFRRRKTRIDVGYLAVDPAVTYYALCFYCRHPELRSELETQKGIERIRHVDFPGVLDEVRKYGEVRNASQISP